MRHLCILSIAISTLLASCNSESDIKKEFEQASTASEELEVSIKLNRQFKGYSVILLDSKGAEVLPHQTSDYELVRSVRIDFKDSNVSATREIININCLSSLMAE